MTIAALVATAPLVVSGTIVGTTDPPAGLSGMDVFVIAVDRVLKGPDLSQVRLAGTRFETADQIRLRAGQSGVWILRPLSGNPGVFVASHPMAYVAPDDGVALRAVTRALP